MGNLSFRQSTMNIISLSRVFDKEGTAESSRLCLLTGTPMYRFSQILICFDGWQSRWDISKIKMEPPDRNMYLNGCHRRGCSYISLSCACETDILNPHPGLYTSLGWHVPATLESVLFTLKCDLFADKLYGHSIPIPTGVCLVNHPAQLNLESVTKRVCSFGCKCEYIRYHPCLNWRLTSERLDRDV